MDYTDTEVLEARAQDEAARYTDMLTRPRRALDGVALTSWEDPRETITHDDIDGAKAELTRIKRGLAPDDVEAAVMALTAGERDVDSQVGALVSLAGWPASEIMRLGQPCLCCGGTIPSMGPVSLTVSVAERKKLAHAGHAMEGGHFPIPDAKHLGYAKAYYKQGKHAGQDPKAIRAHINRNAARLGLPGLDDDDDEITDVTGPKPKASKSPRHATRPVQVPRRGQRIAAEGGEPGGGDGPSGGDGAAMTVTLTDDPVSYYVGLAAEENVSSGPLKAHFDFEVHDTGSHPDSDNSSVDAEAEIRRYLSMCSEKPQSGNRTYRPYSLAARNRAEQRELAGGRPQSY